MNGDLLSVLEYLEREKGISRDTLIAAVESSLLSAARKSKITEKELEIKIDPQTGEIRAFALLEIVAKAEDPTSEISLSEARKIVKKAKVGEKIKREVKQKGFGRIAAQTAKQVIIQKIKEAERENVFNEYKGRIGDIVTGSVRRFDRKDIIVDLIKAEALLPFKEQCHGESYNIGNRIRAYIYDVRMSSKGPEILLSRAHPSFVKKLFELEVPEISDGTVQIKGIAREPGYRTKVAVYSRDEKIDCVGACVGLRGSRVKNIVAELGNEKIDIVRWNEDISVYVREALNPAKLKNVELNEAQKSITVIVDDDQLSLSIGKKGQNARLAAKLLGWKIDIKKSSDVNVQDKIEHAWHELAKIEGIDESVAKALVESGYTDIEGLALATYDDLMKIPGVGEKTAEKIINAVKEIKKDKT
ncbi:MAG: transcription termination/antitermination protein NusA [Candidatus Aureabacteria bacterium]|nr:transcription termination/antitermination protein NusA [Candidatus Auribacterota bacterium]